MRFHIDLHVHNHVEDAVLRKLERIMSKIDELNTKIDTWQTERLLSYTLTQQSTTHSVSTSTWVSCTEGNL